MSRVFWATDELKMVGIGVTFEPINILTVLSILARLLMLKSLFHLYLLPLGCIEGGATIYPPSARISTFGITLT